MKKDEVQKAQDEAFEQVEHRCPHCGYCPHCGRSDEPVKTVPYPVPYPYPVIPAPRPIYPHPWRTPYQPYWSNPNTTVTCGGSQSVIASTTGRMH